MLFWSLSPEQTIYIFGTMQTRTNNNNALDHHMICLSLKNMMTNRRDPLDWTLNTSDIGNKDYKRKAETFWLYSKNKKNIYPNQTKWWGMAKQYIQGTTKDVCIDFKEKQTKLLVDYRAKTFSRV